jgi:hypothetical protein
MATLVGAQTHQPRLNSVPFLPLPLTLVTIMSNEAACRTEKGTHPTVRTTPDHRNLVSHNEDESLSTLPNGGYGWAIVVAILFLNAVTWGKKTQYLNSTCTDLQQGLTHRSECICLISKQRLPSLELHLSCTRWSEAFLSLSLCCVHL